MTTLDGAATPAVPTAGRVVCRDGIDRLLLAAAARGVHRQSCLPLGHQPILGRHDDLTGASRRDAIIDEARAEALPAGLASRLDAGAVADWIVGHYPASRYPGVLFGSPHGGTVHLATALRMPWLPSSFTIRIGRLDASAADWVGALHAGAEVAERMTAANPDIVVRQVYDPVRQGPVCAGALTLHVQWRRLPEAYRSFMQERLEPGAAALLLRDTRTWPVLDLGGGHGFQLGGPSEGWDPSDYTLANPSFRDLLGDLGVDRWHPPYPQLPHRYAELSGEPSFERDLREFAGTGSRPTHRVLYPGPEVLSGAVADLYREWLMMQGGDGRRCVVETERLLDPWQVIASGLVPYWCESATRHAVAAAEWWLAGSDPYDSVQVLPAAPGVDCDVYAEPRQWRAVASFGRTESVVSKAAARRYPMRPLPTSHAAEALDAGPRRRGTPAPMRIVDVLGGLLRHGEQAGLLVL